MASSFILAEFLENKLFRPVFMDCVEMWQILSKYRREESVVYSMKAAKTPLLLPFWIPMLQPFFRISLFILWQFHIVGRNVTQCNNTWVQALIPGWFWKFHLKEKDSGEKILKSSNKPCPRQAFIYKSNDIIDMIT